MDIKFKDTSFLLPEGVDANKFLADTVIAVTPKDVLDVFKKHQYQIDMSGEFLKQMTANIKEIAELEIALSEIDKLGLKDLFSVNLRVASFKRAFIERLKIFLNNNFPYLNEDNTFVKELYIVGFAQRLQFCVDNGFKYEDNGKFISELYDANLFAEYTAHKPIEMIKSASDVDYTASLENENAEDRMDPEDLEVYNDIVVKLNGLILKNPMDEVLPLVVKNILANIKGDIMAKSYHNGVINMIERVVEAMEISEIDKMRIEQLISSAFPEELRQEEGRGLV